MLIFLANLDFAILPHCVGGPILQHPPSSAAMLFAPFVFARVAALP